MQLPLGFGELDFGDWAKGLISAFVSGGATAVTGGAAVTMVDPDHFAVGTSKFIEVTAAMFLMSGTMSMFAFLRTKPIPDVKTITTAVATTVQAGLPPKIVTTVQETHVEAVKGPIVLTAPKQDDPAKENQP